MTLAQRVEELTISSGGDSKRTIGEFVLQQKGRLCGFSTQQIANETYTSKSALVGVMAQNTAAAKKPHVWSVGNRETRGSPE